MQRAFTLVEVMVVILILGLITALAAPRVWRWADRLAVASATQEIASFYARARFSAVYHGRRLRIVLDQDSLAATVEAAVDSVLWRQVGPGGRGVVLQSSRSVIRLYPSGLGLGGANTKLVLRRGAAAESLTISRTGRLKRWP
ncbi:MAG: Tfp pilus assembly protein FimT/FimU [Gemmatimonadales bacterium]